MEPKSNMEAFRMLEHTEYTEHTSQPPCNRGAAPWRGKLPATLGLPGRIAQSVNERTLRELRELRENLEASRAHRSRLTPTKRLASCPRQGRFDPFMQSSIRTWG